MAYKLLGMAVWKGMKFFLRRRYGPTYAPKPVVAGGVLVLAIGALLVVMSRRDND